MKYFILITVFLLSSCNYWTQKNETILTGTAQEPLEVTIDCSADTTQENIARIENHKNTINDVWIIFRLNSNCQNAETVFDPKIRQSLSQLSFSYMRLQYDDDEDFNRYPQSAPIITLSDEEYQWISELPITQFVSLVSGIPNIEE